MAMRRGEAKLGGDRHFEGNWGLHFWMPMVDRKQKVESRNRESRFKTQSFQHGGRDATCTCAVVGGSGFQASDPIYDTLTRNSLQS
jgi:hypothetical protein